MQTTDDEFSSLKCRYASKRCWNLRAIKRNGERHNLCEMHRQKANSNQRRLDKKRKAGQAALGLPNHLGSSGFSDLERRIRMRASIALKLEQELGAMPLTTQYIRSPSLHRDGHVARAAEQTAIRAWMNASYPRSPRAMLRVAKMEPSVEIRAWMHCNPLTPPKSEPVSVVTPKLLPRLPLQWRDPGGLSPQCCRAPGTRTSDERPPSSRALTSNRY
ncbi:hypothetical protein GQ600_1389 [Phytophthora cactorum]|nr:hypothetical protein GQ600_1389 [Phytophthora cactorum]